MANDYDNMSQLIKHQLKVIIHNLVCSNIYEMYIFLKVFKYTLFSRVQNIHMEIMINDS